MYNRLVLAVIKFLFRIAWRLRRCSPRPRPEPASVRSVLLFTTTGLGDTILSTPAIAAARRLWPRAEIHVVAHRRWAALLEPDPNIDSLIVYPGKFKKVFSLLGQLRSARPDLAVVLHGNDPDIVPLAWLSGARFVVASARSKLAFLLDRPVDLPRKGRPYIEQRVDMVRAAGGDIAAGGESLFLSEIIQKWADNFWCESGLEPGRRPVILNPGGSLQAKQWPDRHWIALMTRLAEQDHLQIALFGSPAERPLLEKLAGECRPDQAAPILVITLGSVLEAAALVSRAALLVGPDSGLAHVAVSLDVPTLILFGPDDPVLSGPYLNRAPAVVLQADPSVCPNIADCRKKICSPSLCMEALTAERVWAALETSFNLT